MSHPRLEEAHSCLHLGLECYFLLREHSQEDWDPRGCRAGSYKQGHPAYNFANRPSHLAIEKLNASLLPHEIATMPRAMLASLSCHLQPPYGYSKSTGKVNMDLNLHSATV